MFFQEWSVLSSYKISGFTVQPFRFFLSKNVITFKDLFNFLLLSIAAYCSGCYMGQAEFVNSSSKLLNMLKNCLEIDWLRFLNFCLFNPCRLDLFSALFFSILDERWFILRINIRRIFPKPFQTYIEYKCVDLREHSCGTKSKLLPNSLPFCFTFT